MRPLTGSLKGDGMAIGAIPRRGLRSLQCVVDTARLIRYGAAHAG